jgi:serine/threonine protein kinase
VAPFLRSLHRHGDQLAVDLKTFDPLRIAAQCPGLTVPNPQHPLGVGGQKAVWRCSYNGADYALKVLVSEPATTERAKREVEVMRVCGGPHFARIGPLPLTLLDLGTGDAILYFLEEFIDGNSLDKVTKPFALSEVKSLGLHIASAIGDLASKGYLHRDIKPANIMQRNSNRDFVLFDAGLALDFAGPSITQLGGVVGTLSYLSPEQLQMSKRDLDFRSDMFALGITMYECASGVHPFWNNLLPRGSVTWNIVHSAAVDPRQFNALLSDGMVDLIMRLLENQRHLRYAKIQHFSDDLQRITI